MVLSVSALCVDVSRPASGGGALQPWTKEASLGSLVRRPRVPAWLSPQKVVWGQWKPEKGGRKPALSLNLFVSAQKCRGSGHDRSYHPKRPLPIPCEQKPKSSAAPLEDFSLLCNPSPPPSSVSLLIPLQTILFPTATDAALRWASEFLHFPPFSRCF